MYLKGIATTKLSTYLVERHISKHNARVAVPFVVILIFKHKVLQSTFPNRKNILCERLKNGSKTV